MKKAFVAILSLAALVACSQDVTVKRNDSAAIGFDNSFVENKTRAAADPSKTTATLEEFAVWGFRDTADQLVLNNERVYKDGTEWTYDHLQYWMKDKDYFFGAVSPVNRDDIITVDTKTMSKDGLGIISFTNTDGSVDLLYAEKTVYASEINPSDPDKVQLQFAHLLSRVKFSFAYNFPNELTTIAVKNIEITNSPAEGSIDVTVDRPYWSWNIPQNGSTLKVAFGDVEGGKEFAELNTYYESDDYRLLIPTDDTRGHNITFDVVVYQNHVESYTYHLATTLKDKAFVQGKSYNIVTTITPDELGMKPIQFTVVEVEGWEDGDVAAPVALASPAVEATVAQNVVTLKWNAIEGADHYTVQVDDDIAEVVKDTTYVFEGDYAVEYTFNVVAVPADGLNILASEPAVVKATTDAKPVPGHKLYLKNVDGWDKVFVYAWDAENTPILGVWPGVEMTEKETIDEVEYFVYTLSSELNDKTINVIFNNGSDKQTADITGVELTKDNTFTNYVDPVKPTETKLYLQPNANWNIDNARFAAYLWGNGVSAVWYDMTLVEGETDIYEFTLPEGYENIIFCRMNPSNTANDWNNKWNQTADLKVPTDGTNLYIVKEDTWDNGGGTWGTYEPVVAAPVALATPDVAASVEGNVVTLTWADVENAAQYSITVGTETPVFVEETTYVFTGEYETEYTFNVVAVPADEEKFAASEAAVVTATTEAEKTIEPEELIALDADCYYIFKPATEIKGGKWYALVYDTKAATGLPSNFGYLKTTTALARTEGISLPATCAFGFLTTDGGFTIQQFDGKYVYQSGTYDSFNVAATASEGHVWSVGENGITNNATSKFVQYDPAYGTYGCYATAKGNIPAYYEMVEVDTTPVIVDLSASSLSFGQDAESKVVEVAIYGSATLSASASETWVSAEVSGNNTITVSVEANEGEAREAAVTINYGNDSRTVNVSQAGAGASDTKGTYTSEDFLKGGTSTGGKYYLEKVNVGGTSYDCLKLGTSSVVGDYTTKAVNEAGDLTLSFYAVGWNGKTSKLNVYVDGVKVGETLTLTANSGAANNSPYTITPSDDKDYYSISLTGVTESSKIKFETVSGATRAIIFGVQLY